MPSKPKKPCSYPMCGELTTEAYCEDHKKQDKRSRDKNRGTAHERGYNARWRKARKMYLARNPLCQCEDCQKLIVPLPANVVDHIEPHKGDYELFWDEDNWMAMNKRCHDRKTARKDGGFGR
jgi:5-methylcytosine-specific restriction protein A